MPKLISTCESETNYLLNYQTNVHYVMGIFMSLFGLVLLSIPIGSSYLYMEPIFKVFTFIGTVLLVYASFFTVKNRW